ncbi:MAG: glycine zipper 2TM domain-containing protein [Spongiibacteraceae bacterium]
MTTLGRLGVTALLAVTYAIISSTTAFAYRRDRDDAVEYAPVTRVEPVYESREIVQPQEQCWTEQVPVRSNAPHSYTAPILGAIIGGALGNSLGHHDSNKKVGTVVGAALGGSIGRDIGYRNSGGYQQVSYRDEEICRTVAHSSYREEVVGYRVSYRYHGRDYTTEMPYDPGARIPVRVDVEPAGW